MRRIKLRKKYIFRHKFSIGEKILIILTFLALFIFISFRYINSSVTPVLMNYAQIEAHKFINVIVNKAISESKIDTKEDFVILSKTNDEINMIDFNMEKVNEYLTTISSNIEESIRLMENGQLTNVPGYDNDKLKKGVIYEIPSGMIFKNDLLSNLGPKIPVKISMRGSILSNIDTNITNYGINNALVKISINLTLDEQVLLPFTLKQLKVETSIPIIVKLIEGNVPLYYAGGLNQSSPILSLPLEEN